VHRCFRAAQSSKLFAKELQRRTARLSPAVQVREETPGKGSDNGGAIAYLILQIKKPHALTGLNFCSRFTFRWLMCRTVFLPITSAGHFLNLHARTGNNDARQGVDDPLDVT
jgi:hypothetical protein